MLPRRLPLLLVRWAARRPGTVVAGALLLAGLSLLAARSVEIQTEVLELIPERNEVVREFRTTVDRFGAIDVMPLAVVVDKGDLEGALEYADHLAAGLRRSSLIGWVEVSAEDLLRLTDLVLSRAPLFMTPAGVEELLFRLREPELSAQLEQLAREIRLPSGSGPEEVLAADPLDMLGLVRRGSDVGGLASRFDPATGHLLDPKRRLVMVLAEPLRPASDLPFSRRLMAELEEVRRQADESWRRRRGGADGAEPASPPRLLVGGGHRIGVEDSRMALRELGVGSAAALLAVALLFGYAFGRGRAALIALVPLVVGLLLTLGLAALTLGRLNSFTTVFAALLIGLGIDFVIVLYARYVEGRRRGLSHTRAVEAFGRETAVGVVLGAVTTAATFFAFFVSDFVGLRELGFLTGGGVLIMLLTVLLLLPALVTLLDRERARERHRLRGLGGPALVAWSLAHPRRALEAGLAVTVLLAWAATGAVYDDDVRNLRATENPGFVAHESIMEAFGVRLTPLMVRLDGAGEEAVISRAHALLPRLEALVEDGHLARIQSVAPLIPDFRRQRRVLARLRSSDLDPERTRKRVAAALEAAGLRPQVFERGLENLRAALAVDTPLSLTELARGPAGPLVNRFFATWEGGCSTLVYCYPPAGRWRRGAPPPLTRLVEATPDAVLTGPAIVSQELKRIVWRDATLASGLGLLLVLGLLWIDLRSLADALLVLLPLLLGLVWMTGLMTLLGMPVNFMNIFVFTMIIGIGVDYGIHQVHRWREARERPEAALGGVSAAVLLAAVTTMIGFGSLWLSHMPAVRSMGAAAVLGAASTAVLSIVLLPAVMALWRRREKAPEARGEGPG